MHVFASSAVRSASVAVAVLAAACSSGGVAGVSAVSGEDAGPDAADAGSSVTAAPDAGACGPDPADPSDLGCTGLYSDWAAKTIAPTVLAYAPGYALWSDGADKSRYIELPPGTRVDTTDMDEWSFPVGTKIWKEFRLNGAPVETRFLWKQPDGRWLRTTYAWSADGASAPELTTGRKNVGGTTYEIPEQRLCDKCHQGRVDGVLGFEAVSLSAPGATGLTMDELVRRGLVTTAPAAPIVVPGDAAASAALGWLHANCGTACHNRTPAAYRGQAALFMRLDVATLGSVEATDAYTTGVGQSSVWQPVEGGGMLRIAPHDTANSTVYFRASHRDAAGQGYQMPPYATHAVSEDGDAILAAWIAALP